jgi:MFS family permease
MPFVLVGMPITALFFVLIPRAEALLPLLTVTLLMNVGIAVFNSPTIALMPDITPEEQRSKANGIINFMGGLGALLAFFVGSRLYKLDRTIPFNLTSVLLIAAMVLIFVFIRERRHSLLYLRETASREAGEGEQLGLGDIGGLMSSARELLAEKNRRPRFLILGCFSWVAAVNGAQNMFTRYGVHHLGIDAADASFMLGFFALAFIVFAVPAGYLADILGRKNTIMAGISGTLAAFVLLSIVASPLWGKVLFLFAGLSWALIITNAYPMLMNMTPPEKSGTYTGLWNMTIAFAGLVSPPIYGWVVDLLGYGSFFVTGVAFLLGALVCMQLGWRFRKNLK